MNLLGKLYYVYHVTPPTDEDEDFVQVKKCHDDYLGCSQVKGIFTSKSKADKFARNLAYKLQVVQWKYDTRTI